MDKKIHTLIMAAGKGSRMISKKPKVNHKILGKEMIVRVAELAEKISTGKIITVVGHKKEEVMDSLKSFDISFVNQEKQLGTGHAAIVASQELKGLEGKLIILYGDVPLIREASIQKVIDINNAKNEDLTIATAEVENPTGSGRIIRDNGKVIKIVEEADADEIQKKIKEINTGIYCIDIPKLLEGLKELNNDNAQGEYYITDLVKIFSLKGYNVGTCVIDDITEILNVNSRFQLEIVTTYLKRLINIKYMSSGVTIEDINTVYIYDNVKIGMDTIIQPNVVIEENVIIGEDCIIGAGSYIKAGSNIEAGTVIAPNTVIE